MFLIMVNNYWGKGETQEDCKKQIKKESGRAVTKKMPKIVWAFDLANTPQCYISEMGSLCWEGVKPIEIERVS